MATTPDPEPEGHQLRDAVFSTVHGGLRILGGMVQMAAGITKLVAVAAIKAAAAVEAAVEAGESGEEEPETELAPDPKPRPKPKPKPR